jgi:hypothetical protein
LLAVMPAVPRMQSMDFSDSSVGGTEVWFHDAEAFLWQNELWNIVVSFCDENNEDSK